MMAVGAGPILAGPFFKWFQHQYVLNTFRRGGEQVVNLEIPSCLTKDTIFHEVFHALGKGGWRVQKYENIVNAVHEQSRPDRDDHVEVLLQNVESGQEDQFEIKKNVDVANTGFGTRSICL